MASYTFYNNDGMVTSNVSCSPEDLALNPDWGTQYIEGTFQYNDYYIADGNAVLKQSFTPVVQGHIVSGLPIPCKARIEGTEYDITDGVIELDANLVGPYTIKITSVQYKDKEVTV